MKREAFEEWITAPPYERDTRRWPEDESYCSWPGQYQDIAVQIAWDAWQQGGRNHDTEGGAQ